MIRILAIASVLAQAMLALSGCSPSYSPDTYATNAVQQTAKVDSAVVIGVRPVQISAQGAVGGVAGAAAGGVAGAQVGVGPTSALTAIGGSLVGGIAGVATEHIIGDTNGFEYIVRKPNGDMLSVVQKDKKPLKVGQKVLVISGPQARIVADYTVPFDGAPKSADKPGSSAPADGSAPHSATAEAVPHLPAEPGVPPQLPAAFASPSTTPPAIITPLDASGTPVAPSSAASKP